MHIEHVGLWVKDLEKIRAFYETYFEVKVSSRYHNPKTGFMSYFLIFDEGCRLEIMTKADLSSRGDAQLGYAHIALALEDKQTVDAYVARCLAADVPVLSGPRTTGDGYYEAVIQDPEGNQIELTV